MPATPCTAGRVGRGVAVQEPYVIHQVGGIGGSSVPKCQRETSDQEIKMQGPWEGNNPLLFWALFLDFGCECSSTSVYWILMVTNYIEIVVFIITKESPVLYKLVCTSQTIIPPHPDDAQRGLGSSEQHHTIRAGGHPNWWVAPGQEDKDKAHFECKNPFGQCSSVHSSFCGDSCGVLHGGKCQVPPFYLSSRPWDLDHRLLPLISWFGAASHRDGLVPMNCTLVASGWNKIMIVIINVIIIIAHCFYSSSLLSLVWTSFSCHLF